MRVSLVFHLKRSTRKSQGNNQDFIFFNLRTVIEAGRKKNRRSVLNQWDEMFDRSHFLYSRTGIIKSADPTYIRTIMLWFEARHSIKDNQIMVIFLYDHNQNNKSKFSKIALKSAVRNISFGNKIYTRMSKSNFKQIWEVPFLQLLFFSLQLRFTDEVYVGKSFIHPSSSKLVFSSV